MQPHLKMLLPFAAVLALGACASNPDMPNTYRGKSLHFDEMDKSGDGKLTLDEINPDLKLYAEYARWDSNANGVIEENEFFNYVEAQ